MTFMRTPLSVDTDRTHNVAQGKDSNESLLRPATRCGYERRLTFKRRLNEQVGNVLVYC